MVHDNCCVPFCSNHSGNCDKGVVSWHVIPKNEKLRKEWIIKIRRDVGKKFKITRHSKVRSAHFLASDFRPILNKKKRLLKLEAVPSIFIWNDDKVIIRLCIM